jgi:hypothetical protein
MAMKLSESSAMRVIEPIIERQREAGSAHSVLSVGAKGQPAPQPDIIKKNG